MAQFEVISANYVRNLMWFRIKVQQTESRATKQQVETLLEKGRHDDELIQALFVSYTFRVACVLNMSWWRQTHDRSSSSLCSRSVPWLGEGLSMQSPNYPVLRCPLPDRVAPVFVQVISPPHGWSPLSSFLVVWSPSGDTQLPSVVFDAVDVACPGTYYFFLTLLNITMNRGNGNECICPSFETLTWPAAIKIPT